jgi:hypothetical protein
VRLIDLEPRWLSVAGRHGQSVAFRCPLHPNDAKDRLAIPFANPVDGGEPRTGNCINGAMWHGFITNGEVTNA